MRVGTQVEKGKFLKVGFNKDELVRHGVILGSTGSGKTGLGIGLLEQLAMDGVPIIAIDPKGDLGNIVNVPLMGKHVANAESDWGRDQLVQKDIKARAKLKSVDVNIYTPGVASGGGKKLDIYGSSKGSRSEYLKQVLSLAYGYPVDSLFVPYVFLEEEIAWAEKCVGGVDVHVETLIHYAMNPGTKNCGIGSLSLDDYISESQRMELARKLTSLSASKDFQRWSEGELNIESLFLQKDTLGMNCWDDFTPRLSIISIAHLSENDRKFFLPIFLSELVSTMRKWQGTDKLRAVLYIDECVGMIPSVSTPPTKNWIMTLLKQARAYGLGVVLATQNPADLDYKALGNVGSWWIGRLQTDRDRSKVREALRASEAGVNLGDLLKELEPRQFVQSINGNDPVLVKSNDCLSTLSGPMTLQQIQDVMHWKLPAYQVKYEKGINEYALYRRMIIAGAKNATYGMREELDELRYLRTFFGEPEEGFIGIPNFLWRESIKPTLKARLRMVQDALMQAYLSSAKKQLVKEKVG